MRVIAPVLREVGWLIDRLVNDHTSELLGLEVTTQKRANKRAHDAFKVGADVGARGAVCLPSRPQRVS